MSCLISFISVLLAFSKSVSFASLGSFFFFFSLLFYSFCFSGQWDCFLISLSDLSLLAYKNARDFWVFILYPATGPISLSSGSFLGASLEFSKYSICHLQTMKVLLFRFEFLLSILLL